MFYIFAGALDWDARYREDTQGENLARKEASFLWLASWQGERPALQARALLHRTNLSISHCSHDLSKQASRFLSYQYHLKWLVHCTARNKNISVSQMSHKKAQYELKHFPSNSSKWSGLCNMQYFLKPPCGKN